MRLHFEYQITDDGICIGLFDKKLFGSKKIVPFSQWAATLDKTAWRHINGLIEKERASADAGHLLLPHRTVASLPQVLCTRFNLPELARLSVALQFNGRIDSADGHLGLEWHDENFRVARPTRRGAIVEIGDEPWRLSPLFLRCVKRSMALTRHGVKAETNEYRLGALSAMLSTEALAPTSARTAMPKASTSFKLALFRLISSKVRRVPISNRS